MDGIRYPKKLAAKANKRERRERLTGELPRLHRPSSVEKQQSVWSFQRSRAEASSTFSSIDIEKAIEEARNFDEEKECSPLSKDDDEYRSLLSRVHKRRKFSSNGSRPYMQSLPVLTDEET